jgi:hypothetical protein
MKECLKDDLKKNFIEKENEKSFD